MSPSRQLKSDLQSSYARALREYLLLGGEAPLHQAYELGRQGLSDGSGVLDMVNLHQAALASIFRQKLAGEITVESISRAGEFFAESMSCFEMSQRAVGEANAVLRKLNDTLEEEARRIAHALHDDAGQLMVAAHMSLDDALKDLPPAVRERMRDVKILLTRVDERIRDLSHELRPAMLDHLGLVPAVEFLAASVAQRSGLRITVDSTLSGQLPSKLAIAFYRIVQEALTNVRRHARASTIQICFRNHGPSVRCSVTDDGVGFNQERLKRSSSPGLGLLGIQERLNALGGILNIRSERGKGTTLEFTAPLLEEKNGDSNLNRRRSSNCA
jgi:signal transduction histidine kinase